MAIVATGPRQTGKLPPSFELPFSCNLLWKKIDSLVSCNKRCLLNAIPTPVLRGCFDVLSTTLVSQSLCVGSFP